MSYEVTLKSSGRTFQVEALETILDAANRQGIGLPYGCKSGACGACKATVLSGEFTQHWAQPNALSETEQAEGKALLCCCYAQSDLEIQASEKPQTSSIQIKTLPCRVENIHKIHDVAVLRLKLPAADAFVFKAGQYIDILMRDGKKRSFSIANAPQDEGYLDLHIRHQKGGSFSDYVFNQMQPREIMRFQGPLGTFFMPEAERNRPILMIASGTGFAPIKSMVEDLAHQGSLPPIVFYWGARTKADLYMHELAMSWTDRFPNFQYIPVLSEPCDSDRWQGRTGFVHQAVLDDYASLADFDVYACGAPLMVEAAFRSFTQEKQLPEAAFFADAFYLSVDSNAQK